MLSPVNDRIARFLDLLNDMEPRHFLSLGFFTGFILGLCGEMGFAGSLALALFFMFPLAFILLFILYLPPLAYMYVNLTVLTAAAFCREFVRLWRIHFHFNKCKQLPPSR